MGTFTLHEIAPEDAGPRLEGFCENVPFTQAGFYGGWQESLGRKVRRFVVLSGSDTIAYFQMVRYPLVFGRYYYYIPYGPLMKGDHEGFFPFLKEELTRIARSDGAVFVRLDVTPPLPGKVLARYFEKAPSYTYHSAYFQPRTEWFLGLGKTEEELLAAMHEKTRYSVRLAERKGVMAEIVTEGFEGYFGIFYELMEGTAGRNGFRLHEKAYYERVFRDLEATGSYLSIAKYGEKVLAIDLVIPFAGIAHYVFGGSSDEERNRVPTYLAQWKAICHARTLGCRFYNFGGISSEERTYKGWDGLTLFKKKFGGEEVRHSDFFDVVAEPLWYRLYNLRKRLKAFIA